MDDLDKPEIDIHQSQPTQRSISPSALAGQSLISRSNSGIVVLDPYTQPSPARKNNSCSFPHSATPNCLISISSRVYLPRVYNHCPLTSLLQSIACVVVQSPSSETNFVPLAACLVCTIPKYSTILTMFSRPCISDITFQSFASPKFASARFHYPCRAIPTGQPHPHFQKTCCSISC